MKFYIVALCIFQIVFAIPVSDVTIIKSALAAAYNDGIQIHSLSSLLPYAGSQYGSTVDLVVDNSFGQILNALSQIGQIQGASGIQAACQNIAVQAKTIVQILDDAGASQETIFSYAFPKSYSDLIRKLSTVGNQLDSSIAIVNVPYPAIPSVNLPRPDSATVTALRNAIQSALNSGIVLNNPTFVNGLNTYNSQIISSFNSLLTTLGNTLYNLISNVHEPTALNAKNTLADVAVQISTLGNVYKNNGVNIGQLIFEVAVKAFTDVINAANSLTATW